MLVPVTTDEPSRRLAPSESPHPPTGQGWPNAGGGNSGMVDASAHQRPLQRLHRHAANLEKPVTQPKGNTVPLT
jgi:hypothetical protein